VSPFFGSFVRSFVRRCVRAHARGNARTRRTSLPFVLVALGAAGFASPAASSSGAHGVRPPQARTARVTRAAAGETADLPGVTLTHGGRPIAPALGQGSPQGAKGGAGAEPDPAGVAVPRRFTENSRTWESDGLVTTRIFSAPVNFKGPGGGWQPIENQLVAVGSAFENRANRYRVRLPRDLSTGPVRVSIGSAWVTFALVGGRGHAVVKGNTATYPSVLPGVTLSYAAENAAVKEALVLSNRRAPSRFTFALRANRGLRLRYRGKQLELQNRAGKTVLKLGEPFAYTKKGSKTGAGHRVHVRLKKVHGGWRLTLSLDRRWLRRAFRRHQQVVIDPSLNANFNQDCMNQSNTPTTNYCSSNLDQVGWDGTADHHAFVQFYVPSILPPDSKILNAKLGMYLSAETTTNVKSVSAQRVTHSWTQSVNWNTYNGTNNWTTAGGDANTDLQAINPSVGGSTGWYYWYPTQLVQGWEDGTQPNYGFMLTDTTFHGTNNGLKFYSSLGPSANVPYLQITYEPRGIGEGSQFTLLHTSLTDTTDMAVNVASGDLRIVNRDLQTQGTGLPFVEQRTWDNLLMDANSFYRWSSSMWPILRVFGNGDVGFNLPDGSWEPFFKQSDGSYVAPIGFDMTLCKIGLSGCSGNTTKDAQAYTGATPSYVLTNNADGATIDFDNNGSPLSFADRHGNAIVAQQSAGLINHYLDTQGRQIAQTYATTANYIGGLSDWTGRGTSYTYNTADSNKLTSFTDANGKTTTYAWGSGWGGDLLQITDPNGQITKMTYDSNHRVTSVTRVTNNTTLTGPTTTYGYYSGTDTTHGHTCSVTSQTKKTTVTDDNGHVTTYCSNILDEVFETWDPLGNKEGSQYSPSGKLASYSDPTLAGSSAHSIDLTYATGAPDNLTSETESGGTSASPTSLTTQYVYTGAPGGSGPGGNNPRDPWEAIDPQGVTTGFAYNSTRDMIEQGPFNASGFTTGATKTSYNSNGTIASTTNGNGTSSSGYTTTYSYNPTGTSQLASVTPPNITALGAMSYTEDTLGRVKTISDGNGNTQTYTYDPLDRITNVKYQNGSSTNNVGYIYDDDGNVTQRTDDVNGSTTYTYDKLNRPTQEQFPGGVTNSYTYDGTDNLTSFTDDAGTYTYTYRANDELQSITQPGISTPITWQPFDYTNNKQEVDYPNGVVAVMTYDLDGRVVEIKATKASAVLQDLQYSYDSGSNHYTKLQKVTDALTGNYTTYTYGDSLGRLTQAQTKNSGGTVLDTQTYSYDGAGNMAAHNGNSYTYNADNQRTGTGSSSDSNGNVTATAGGPSATYNSRNQTSSVTPFGGSATSLGFLGSGQDELMSDATQGLHYSSLGLSWMYDGSSHYYYTRTPSGDVVGMLKKTGSTTTARYPLVDTRGSIVGQTDSAGAVARSYSYDPYGNRTITGGTAFDDTLGYLGEPHTSSGLVHLGSRLYDASTGRFTQMDPDGNDVAALVVCARGALSQDYSYAGDDPINYADPSGRAFWKKVLRFVRVLRPVYTVVRFVQCSVYYQRVAHRVCGHYGAWSKGRAVCSIRTEVTSYTSCYTAWVRRVHWVYVMSGEYAWIRS
jgi:RHS repeat-associated protein